MTISTFQFEMLQFLLKHFGHKILEARSRSRTFYLRLRNPALQSKFYAVVIRWSNYCLKMMQVNNFSLSKVVLQFYVFAHVITHKVNDATHSKLRVK